MYWKIPPKIKIYEALGCIADDRLEIENNNLAKVYSSSRNKFYTIEFDKSTHSIMCNDNGSYYIGYLGYPALSYLMKIGELEYNEEYGKALKGIHWKDLNQKYDKNNGVGIPNYDFDKVIEEINIILENNEINLEEFNGYVNRIIISLEEKKYKLLGEKIEPPKGY